MRTATSTVTEARSPRVRGRRVGAAVAAAAAAGVLAVGCGEDDPVLEGPDPQDSGEEQSGDEADAGGDGGLY